MMKEGCLCYVIDPLAGTLQRARLFGDYRAIHAAGGYDCFDLVRFGPQGLDAIYVDDEGLLHPNPPENFFMLKNYPNPLCGKGVVLGSDIEGESIAPLTAWEDFTPLVKRVIILRINGAPIIAPGEPFKVLDDIIDIHAKD